MRGEEPERVAFEGSAKRDVRIVGAIGRVDEVKAAVLQLLGQVVADHVVVREVAAGESRENVAAVLRNHVGLEAAVLEFSRLPAELHARFLCGSGIEIEPASLSFAV